MIRQSLLDKFFLDPISSTPSQNSPPSRDDKPVGTFLSPVAATAVTLFFKTSGPWMDTLNPSITTPTNTSNIMVEQKSMYVTKKSADQRPELAWAIFTFAGSTRRPKSISR